MIGKKNFELLKKYILQNNNQYPSQNYTTKCGVQIGRWVSKQRQDKKKGKLSQDKIDKFNSLSGWYWELILLNRIWNGKTIIIY